MSVHVTPHGAIVAAERLRLYSRGVCCELSVYIASGARDGDCDELVTVACGVLDEARDLAPPRWQQ